MKTITRLILFSLIIVASSTISSCKKEAGTPANGTAEFALNMPVALSHLKSVNAENAADSYQILISVIDSKGNLILSDKLIPLYTFGTGFVSDKIPITAGEYKLTKFMIINTSGAVVYATPLKGSTLGYLTNRPLPMSFTINADKVTSITPEVLSVGDQAPSLFGYATFGMQIITPLDFYTYCIISNPNSQILAPVVMTNACLNVSDNKGWSYTFNLTNTINHLVIRGGADKYSFSLSKDGYATQKFEYTLQQLKDAKLENPLVLKIPTTASLLSMFFQPGPQDGKDAMISSLDPDKNFGDSKYFEATYMTESTLTVIPSTRSLISYNLGTLPAGAVISKVVLKLFYDAPIPWDNSIYVSATSTIPLLAYGVLQQITEPWEESKVTWNNQPKTSEVNQIYIYPFVRNVNYIEIDVTKQFVVPTASLLPNYGMLFKLYPNTKFKGFRFASSDYADPAMRPRLNVFYTK
jgi:hypothetical protein